MSEGYTIQAINLFETINIKGIRALLSGKILDSSPLEMNVQYGESGFLFVFRFGCLVFFNMTPSDIARETDRLKAALASTLLEGPTSEAYTVSLGDGPPRVEFDYVEIKKLSLDLLRIIALTIAQSAALEYFEVRTDAMLHDTAILFKPLAQHGKLRFRADHLIKTIGSTAGTRQNIISTLAILDPPEATWKSKELERLFRELQMNFDIDLRFRTLDRKLSLIQDNLEIFAGLLEARKTNFLELLIVVLIILELAMAIFK